MGKLISIVAVVVIAMLLLPAVALAQAPPVCSFYGSLEVDGADAPVGTVVSAWMDDAMVASATTTSVGLHVIKVVQPEGETYGNKTVAFRVNDIATGVTSTWEAGGAKSVPLTVGEGPIGPGAELEVVVSWTEGNSTLVDNVLTLYLGEKPADGAKGDTGDTGATGDPGEPGEDAAGGIALPIVALVIAIIAAGMAMMSMRRRV